MNPVVDPEGCLPLLRRPPVQVTTVLRKAFVAVFFPEDFSNNCRRAARVVSGRRNRDAHAMNEWVFLECPRLRQSFGSAARVDEAGYLGQRHLAKPAFRS